MEAQRTVVTPRERLQQWAAYEEWRRKQPATKRSPAEKMAACQELMRFATSIRPRPLASVEEIADGREQMLRALGHLS